MTWAALDLATNATQQLLNLATALWLASVGASVGSFINVVAYRLPLGASIVWIPSRCPKCGYPIRLRDNIPLFGWLILSGRCRDCGVRISLRYFMVEAVMAAAFLLLAYVELFSGGANLPNGPLTSFTGAWGTIWHPEWELIGVYFYHCALLSVLMAVALIDLDGERVPWKLFGFGIALSIAAKYSLPSASVISGGMLSEYLRSRPLVAAGVGATLGAVLFACFAFVTRALRMLPYPIGPRRPVGKLAHYHNSIVASTLFGMLFGASRSTWWGAVVVFCAVWLILFGMTLLTPERKLRGSIPFALWPTTFILLLWWKPLVDVIGRTIPM